MRVIGLIPWFDERPDWLAASIASMGRFCDHIVAADGAYQLYPGGKASSSADEVAAVVSTTLGAGMGLTLIVPRERWVNNEIAKRNALLEAADAIAEPGDWYFWLDADMVVLEVPGDLSARLAESKLFVGHATLWTSVHENEDINDGAGWHEFDRKHPLFVRAGLGIRVHWNHWTWIGVDPDTRLEVVVRGNQHEYQLTPPLDLTDVLVEHRSRSRHKDRALTARKYYEIRDLSGAEKSRQVYMETETGDIKGVA